MLQFPPNSGLARDEGASVSSSPIDAEEGCSARPITCPVCGDRCLQEKCKIVCRSEICRGRVVMNCSEF